MTDILIHQNSDEGAQWWAENGAGYYDYADSIQELLLSIQKWAEWQGINAFTVRLAPEPVEEEPFRAAYQIREPVGIVSPSGTAGTAAVSSVRPTLAIA